MSSKNSQRKRGLVALVAATALPLSVAQGFAQDLETETLDEVVAGATEEGMILYYDSMVPDQADEVMNDFKEAYPGIDFDYVFLGGSQRLARVTQESMGGGPTGDILTDTPGNIMTLAQQGYVRAIDWEKLGFEAGSADVPNEYMARTNAAVYVTIYNTNLVDEADLPKTYDDLLTDKFSGNWGTWARPNGFLNLLPAWGEEKIRTFVEGLAETQPVLYRAPQAAAEAVGAGEIPIAHFMPYHTVLPTIEGGAPIDFVFLEPIPIASVYGFLPTYGGNPSAGKLYLSWLASSPGASSVELRTGRGNPFVDGTKMGEVIDGMEVTTLSAEYEIENTEYIRDFETELGEILQGRR